MCGKHYSVHSSAEYFWPSGHYCALYKYMHIKIMHICKTNKASRENHNNVNCKPLVGLAHNCFMSGDFEKQDNHGMVALRMIPRTKENARNIHNKKRCGKVWGYKYSST